MKKNETKLFFEKIIGIFAWLSFFLAIFIAIITFFASLSGEKNGKEIFSRKMLIVKGDSMTKSEISENEEIFFGVGDLIVVKTVDNPEKLKAGEVKCTSLSASGSVNGDALVCSGDVKISGASSFSGEVRAKSISVAGAFRAKSNISCDEITAKGIIKAAGEVSALSKIEIHGAVKSEETLSAPEIFIKFDSDVELTSVKGTKISITPLRKFKLFKRKCITLSSIEGDDIELEYVTCPRVSGKNVKIGNGCRIELLEYSEGIDVSDKAKIRKTQRI